VSARKLGRRSDHRRAMFRGMVTFLLEKGKIKTTVTRAKELRSIAERIITIGKSADLSSKRKVLSYVTKEGIVKRVFDEIAPKYADVSGGYTRITKIGPRKGDAAEMAVVELIAGDSVRGGGMTSKGDTEE
jgi:large subunit ribosomal protein L17